VTDAESIIQVLQGLFMVVASVLIVLACVGLWRFKDDVSNVLYARIHIVGVVDVTCIALLLILGFPLVALTYFFLMPVAGHTIANARYYMKKEAWEE